MPILRTDFINFVQVWNAHRIRRQKGRPHVIHGRPWFLYFQPNLQTAQDFAQPVNPNQIQELLDLIQQDEDIDAFLPKDTFQVCQHIMESCSESLPKTTKLNNTEYPAFEAYQYLRIRLKRHIFENNQPSISLLDKPDSGIKWAKNVWSTLEFRLIHWIQ